MASYREEIAALRQEAAERQLENIQQQARDARDAVWQNEQAAIEAHQRGDADTARYYAEQANESEQQYLAVASMLPPQPQQIDPTVAEFAQQFRPWIEKHGQRAIEGLSLAHNYATRPRTGSNNPQFHGMGLAYGSEAYKSAIKDLLQMYGADHGIPFDPNSEMIGPDEAAKISGCSPREYNEGVRKMMAEGRDLASEQSMWDRKVG